MIRVSPHTGTLLIFAGALAAGVFVLEWLEYRFWTRTLGVEVFAGILAILFAALGIWLGFQLTRKSPAPASFKRNEAALASLGITRRELDVLEALVSGGSNKAIARQLGVSPNTVKTHTARLYDKLDVSGRIEAIEQARTLRLIPASGTPVTDASENG